MIDSQPKNKLITPIQLLLVVVVSTFTVEIAIMFTLPYLPYFAEWVRAIIDAGLLVMITFPVVYFFFYRPMAKQIRSRELAEKALQEMVENLELRVNQRTAELVRSNAELQKEITKRNLADLALKKSESRLANILNNASEAIISLDENHNILLFNKGAENAFGYLAHEVLGKSLNILLPQRFVQTHRNYFRIQIDDPANSHQMENRESIIGLRKDGEEFPAQVGFSSHLEDDQLIFTAILVDITERNKAEKALISSEERYRNLFSRIPVGLYRSTPVGKILDANPALVELLGFPSRDELMRINVADAYVNPEDRNRENILMEKNGIIRGYQYQVQRFDGQKIWVRDTSLLIRGDDGTPLYYEGSLEDITDQLQAQEQIRINAARTRLLAEVSKLIAEVGLDYRAILDVVMNRIGEWVGDACRIRLFNDNDQEFNFNDPNSNELIIPLRVHGRNIGVIEIAREALAPAYPVDYQEILQDIADRTALAVNNAQLFEKAQTNLFKIQALHQIDNAIAESEDLKDIFSTLLDQTTLQLGVDAANILVFSPQTLRLDYAASKGFYTNSLQQTHLPLGVGFAGKAALEKHTISISDLRIRGTDLLRSPTFLMEGFVSYHAVPLIAKGLVKGVLEIFQRSLQEPNQEWVEFLEALGKQAAIAIEKAQLFESLQRSNRELFFAYDATIEGWSQALDLRDKETEGHSIRVTQMSLRLSRAMGVSDAELVHVRRGALLHDIGKMGIPDRILLKQGPLTEDEWIIMRKHPIYAYELLSPIAYLKPALDIPYCHHEKWDGSGYPRGLKADQIPLTARIFAVVDVWDALSSDRPYRSAWPVEKVSQYMLEQSGKHFDPRIVEIFLKFIQNEAVNR